MKQNKKFKYIYVEITNKCNLSCSFCSKENRTIKNMSVGEFTQVINKIEQFTGYIYLHVKGEPLLHPELDILLDICASKNIQVNLVTNGVLIEEKQTKLMNKPALREINFSLHSLEEIFPAEKRSEILNSILQFIKFGLENTKAYFSLRLWNLNNDDPSNSGNDFNSFVIQAIEQFFKLKIEISDKSIQLGIKLLPNLYLNFDNRFEWPKMDGSEQNSNGFCHALRAHVAILVDGTVVPCCLDSSAEINLGNIFEQDFEEIINSERAENIYDNFSNRKAVEKLCLTCTYKQRFDDKEKQAVPKK